jgi:DNA-binding transcriptional regulator YiaG
VEFQIYTKFSEILEEYWVEFQTNIKKESGMVLKFARKTFNLFKSKFARILTLIRQLRQT